MKKDQARAIDELRGRLGAMKPSELLDEDTQDLFFDRCWDEFDGTDAEGMKPDKLYRADNVRWEPRCVVFEIERHGATVMGSTRAALHRWSCNVDSLRCECIAIGHRQVRPAAAVWKVEPHVEKIVAAITTGRDAAYLKWSEDRQRVRVLSGKIIPGGVKQTVEGRRKRLARALKEALTGKGWIPAAGAGWYKRST